MKGYKILHIGKAKLQVRGSAEVLVTDEQMAKVQEIWDKTAGLENLYNGSIFSFGKLEIINETAVIKGDFSEYRLFYAQNKRQDLQKIVSPVGVSGLIILEDANDRYVIVAERSDAVTEYPGFFEFTPSGSIEKEFLLPDGSVDFEKQILSEFEEELKIPREAVKEAACFCVIADLSDEVYDIGCIIKLRNTEDLALKKMLNTKEYQNFRVMKLDAVEEFIEKYRDKIVPTSLGLFEAFRLSGLYNDIDQNLP